MREYETDTLESSHVEAPKRPATDGPERAPAGPPERVAPNAPEPVATAAPERVAPDLVASERPTAPAPRGSDRAEQPRLGTDLELAGGHLLRLVREGAHDVLRVESPGGGVALTITLGKEGASLSLDGTDLTLRSSGRLRVDADRLELHGRSGLELSSGGDVEIDAERDLLSRARIQEIRATRGDVRVRANDDVRLNGERVLVNC